MSGLILQKMVDPVTFHISLGTPLDGMRDFLSSQLKGYTTELQARGTGSGKVHKVNPIGGAGVGELHEEQNSLSERQNVRPCMILHSCQSQIVRVAV